MQMVFKTSTKHTRMSMELNGDKAPSAYKKLRGHRFLCDLTNTPPSVTLVSFSESDPKKKENLESLADELLSVTHYACMGYTDCVMSASMLSKYLATFESPFDPQETLVTTGLVV